jgi:hypothetical protein
MMGTVDGRIQTERWSLSPAGEKQYEAVHALHRADAWMCGRRTFQFDFMDQARDAAFSRKAKVPPGDYGAPSLPTVFDLPSAQIGKQATALRLLSAQRRPSDVVWLRYRTK